ncbi:MAG: ATPase [Bacteroidetes bacterium]|nr:MAG: ATPase [Bacteroidota bacterium]
MHIVVTGPESSGKTTLSKQLSEALNGEWIAEYAREYVAELDRPYTIEDIIAIAEGQKLKFDQAKNEIIVSDTAFLVLKIWSEYRFEQAPKIVEDYLNDTYVDLYILCHPEIPWEYDPLRENPDDRIELFERYRSELEKMRAPYIIVQGKEQERLDRVLEYLSAI